MYGFYLKMVFTSHIDNGSHSGRIVWSKSSYISSGMFSDLPFPSAGRVAQPTHAEYLMIQLQLHWSPLMEKKTIWSSSSLGRLVLNGHLRSQAWGFTLHSTSLSISDQHSRKEWLLKSELIIQHHQIIRKLVEVLWKLTQVSEFIGWSKEERKVNIYFHLHGKDTQ